VAAVVIRDDVFVLNAKYQEKSHNAQILAPVPSNAIFRRTLPQVSIFESDIDLAKSLAFSTTYFNFDPRPLFLPRKTVRSRHEDFSRRTSVTRPNIDRPYSSNIFAILSPTINVQTK